VFSTEWLGFVYWFIAKLIIWILPALWLIKKCGLAIRVIFNVSSWHSYLVWGFCIGGVLTLANIIGHCVNNTPILPQAISFSFMNAIIIAPIFEEFIMRGAIMGAFRQKHSFFFANSVTAVLFVILHCPGWYYTGNLWANLLTLAGGAVSIFIIGWLCGLATERGHSVIAGMIVHFLNNIS
ncbi:MAG: CPBP family intramembrane metalloprotease, partial [Dehalococcoidia bacterium]|nr:CPBP family intramembrane metalloprotease [Dehalococcoidia bacterium]